MRARQINSDAMNANASNKTITAAGVTGARTINQSMGSVNFAAAAQTLIVTNSLVNLNSVILVTIASNDANAFAATVVAASGSFTIRLNAAAAAECRVNFVVMN